MKIIDRVAVVKTHVKIVSFASSTKRNVNKITSLASSHVEICCPEKRGRTFQFLFTHKLMANQFNENCVFTSVYLLFNIVSYAKRETLFEIKRKYILTICLFFAMCCRHLNGVCVDSAAKLVSKLVINVSKTFLSGGFQSVRFRKFFFAQEKKIQMENNSEYIQIRNFIAAKPVWWCVAGYTINSKVNAKLLLYFAKSSCFES